MLSDEARSEREVQPKYPAAKIAMIGIILKNISWMRYFRIILPLSLSMEDSFTTEDLYATEDSYIVAISRHWF
jgi:hypothetical protein